MQRLFFIACSQFIAAIFALLLYPFAGYSSLLWFAALALLSGAAVICAVVVCWPVRRQLIGLQDNSPVKMRRPPLKLLSVGCSLFSLCLIFYLLLWQPLPESVLRKTVLYFDDWLVTDYDSTSAGLAVPMSSSSRKYIKTSLEYSLICHFQRRQKSLAATGDAPRMMAYLVPLKQYMLNQIAIPHKPMEWPVLLSGVGQCDQMNRVAALLFAREFPASQTYNLYNPSPYAAHTVGRVWSREHQDWLYYDLWGDEVLVFKFNAATGVQVLERQRPLARSITSPEYDDVLARLYARTGKGWVLNKYQSSFGAYLCRKVWKTITRQTDTGRPPPEPSSSNTIAITSSSPSSPVAATGPPKKSNAATKKSLIKGDTDQFRRYYLEARLEHILGDELLAKEKYRQSAMALSGRNNLEEAIARPGDRRYRSTLESLYTSALFFSKYSH